LLDDLQQILRALSVVATNNCEVKRELVLKASDDLLVPGPYVLPRQTNEDLIRDELRFSLGHSCVPRRSQKVAYFSPSWMYQFLDVPGSRLLRPT